MICRDARLTFKYVLVEDRELPPDQRTCWDLKHMTLLQEAACLDNLDRDSQGFSIRRGLGTERVNLLRSNLVGWSNLKTADGSEIAFEKGPLGGAKDDVIFKLLPRHRDELARAIEDAREFDPETLGKSAPAAT